MNKENTFIGHKDVLKRLIKNLHLKINPEEEKSLLDNLYPHIEHTRIRHYRNGYDQGRFDEKMLKLL